MTDTAENKMPDVINYLLGEGEFEGFRFPDFSDHGEKYKRRYWWRKALRKAWADLSDTQPPQPPADMPEAVDRAIEGINMLSQRLDEAWNENDQKIKESAWHKVGNRAHDLIVHNKETILSALKAYKPETGQAGES